MFTVDSYAATKSGDHAKRIVDRYRSARSSTSRRTTDDSHNYVRTGYAAFGLTDEAKKKQSHLR